MTRSKTRDAVFALGTGQSRSANTVQLLLAAVVEILQYLDRGSGQRFAVCVLDVAGNDRSGSELQKNVIDVPVRGKGD